MSFNLNGAISSVYSRMAPSPKVAGAGLGRALQGVSSVASVLSSAAQQSFPGVFGEFSQLLSKQVEAQQQMQLVSMYSNVEKSRHETSMVAIRNARVG